MLVKNGRLEAGTKKHPYTTKLSITIHGDKTKNPANIPLYGNKVIAARNAQISMHGIKRQPVWTKLDKSARRGDYKITLIREVDWHPQE